MHVLLYQYFHFLTQHQQTHVLRLSFNPIGKCPNVKLKQSPHGGTVPTFIRTRND